MKAFEIEDFSTDMTKIILYITGVYHYAHNMYT